MSAARPAQHRQQVGGAIRLAVLGTIVWSTVADTLRTTGAAIAAGAARPVARGSHTPWPPGFSRGFLSAAGIRCLPCSSRSPPFESAVRN